MTTATTVDALRVELDDLQQRHDAAITQADSARDAKDVTAGRRVLSEATAEELAEAHQALREAEEVASSLAAAVALIAARLSEAEDAERAERRAGLKDAGAQAVKQVAKGRTTIRKGLTTARDGFAAIDDAAGDRAGIRAALLELRDLDGDVAAIEARYKERYEQLRRDAPPGMEPNTVSLEIRMENEIKTVRAAAEAEAAELAPAAGADDLAATVDSFADLVPRLLDSQTRKALAEGREFLTPPRANTMGDLSSRGGVGRFYGDWEFPLAQARFDALQAAITRLTAGVSVDAIGADELRNGGTRLWRG